MHTDWILMRRAARELEAELRGARVVDAGLLDDGRFGLRVAGRRGRSDAVLAVDLFGSPPLVTLEETELALGADPGWARAAAVTLRGMRVGEVRSRRGDRVLVIDLGTTSRFGVEQGVKLVLELVPRFGNLLVLRDRAVIAAAKQFSPAENEARSVGVGQPYQPPPLGEVRLPRMLVEAGADLAAAEAAAEADAPLYVYRDADGRLVEAHVVPLPQFAALRLSRERLLLPLFREARATSTNRRASDAQERRRSALTRRIEKRRAEIEAELMSLEGRRGDDAGREALRTAGDLLHTFGHELPAGASAFRPPTEPEREVALDPELDAKANAARYFSRYRKAVDALPHLERRIAQLTAKRASLEEFAFETERADAATLAELDAALAELDGRIRAQRPAAPAAARTPLRIERPSGARIFVGRSPRENVEVTFRIARPDDLWFHARGIPGSHVVLQPPPGGAPDETDLTAAADLAARHSRARNAPRVEIDFTERKYVRRQRDAAPGLVWYTNARTRQGRPEADL